MASSTIPGAVKALLDRDLITLDEGVYQLSDKFFAQYLLI